MVSDYKNTYYGSYSGTYPSPPQNVDTFTYRVLPGEQVVGAVVSGNRGISGYFNASPAGGYPTTVFPTGVHQRFGAVIESLGDSPAQVVAERPIYLTANGVPWAAGTDALTTRIR